MAIYAIYLPPEAPGSALGIETGKAEARLERAARAHFIRQGFSWGAFCFGPLWLATRGLWLSFFLWIFLTLAAMILLRLGAAGVVIFLTFLILTGIFLGLEGFNLYERRVRRKGYQLTKIIAASGRDTGESRFFSSFNMEVQQAENESEPSAARSQERLPPARAASHRAETSRDLLGLFPSRGPRK